MPEHLFVQWGRLGDLIQTIVVLHRLKKDNPLNRIVLSCDSQYMELAKLFPEVDDVWPLDLQQLFSTARSSASAFLSMEKMAFGIESSSRHFDTVCNLSPSRAAAVFARSVNANLRLGYDLQDQSLAVPPEIVTLHHDTAKGEPTPVHLCDIWTKLSRQNNYTEVPPALSNQNLLKKSLTRCIAVIADAGDPGRQAPIEWSASLISRLAGDSTYEIIVTGIKSDDDAISIVARSCSSIHDLRGTTNLIELLELYCTCDYVIGADTGALHLASACGAKCIGLYSGNALAVQTGPYSLNSTVIQNPLWADLTMGMVIELTRDQSPQSENLWKPTLDKFGLLYKPLIDNRELDKRFAVARQNFMSDSIELEIIIPESGGRHYTEELLSDLSECGLPKDAQVTLVSSGLDRCSPLPQNSNIRIRPISSGAPLTFAESCNLGARESTARWLFFLNNDVRIEKDALTSLWESRKANLILSPLLKYADGLIQNAGVSMNGSEIIERSHGDLDLSYSNTSLDAVSGAAMLLSRSCFEKLGGFDTAFRNGYEDLDFCLRAKEINVDSKVIDESQITHFRGSSSGRFENEAANIALFRTRHAASTSQKTSHANSKRLFPAKYVILSDESANSAGALTRWIWPLENLGLKLDRDFVWISTADVHDTLSLTNLLSEASLVIVYRPLNDLRCQTELLRLAKAREIPLFVDCDDKILNRFSPESSRGKSRTAWENCFRELIVEADCVTASSEELQRDLQRHNPNVITLETVSHPQWQGALHPEQSTGEFRLGFFGTPAHLVDLGSILPAIESTLEEYSLVKFYWWGCRPGELVHHPQVRQGGPVVKDYKVHLSRLRAFNLNAVVVPLLDTIANRCKTAIKFFELGLSGVPAIYSDMSVYSNVVHNEVDGILVKDSTSSWRIAFSRIIESSPLRENIRHLAFNRLTHQAADASRLNTYRDILRLQFNLNSNRTAKHHEVLPA